MAHAIDSAELAVVLINLVLRYPNWNTLKFSMKTDRMNSVVNCRYATMSTTKLSTISSFESGFIASKKSAEQIYGNTRLMAQSKSYLSGIKKAKQTKVPTMLNSRRKVAHFCTFSIDLNFLLRVRRNRFVIELK